MSFLSAPRDNFVFNWHAPAGRNVALIGFLVLSFVAHATGFYLFQIVYPPALSLAPPAARLNLVTPNSEEGRTILRWVEAEDPALASSTLRPAEMKPVSLPVVQHVPSYLLSEPALKDAPPMANNLRIPNSQPPGPVLLPQSHSPEKVIPLPTTISFSEQFAALGTPVSPSTKFVASTKEAPQAISFRVAVGNRGEVAHCFAINSSGDAELDEQARKYLALCRFPQGTTKTSGVAVVWGTATIEWGNDVVLPSNSAATSPP